MSQKHILVVGAGAVGCFYGSKLHDPTNNVYVSLVCRSNYQAIADNGVQMQTRDFGDYHFQPYKVFPSIQSASTEGTVWNYIIVTTKALPDIVDDAQEIEPLVTKGVHGSRIVLIQNGVGIELPHRARFPDNIVISCVTVISAEQIKHGVIRQNRWTRISIGPYTDGIGGDGTSELSAKGNESVQEISRLWNAQGIKDVKVHSEKEFQLIRWHKLIINSAFNPSSILSGGKGNADMITFSNEMRIHIHSCMEEIYQTAPKIFNQPFPSGLATPDAILKSTERNKGAKPSMLIDWQNGRPLELEVILGNPVRIAREHGFEMPRLHSMYALLKSAQAQRQADKKSSKL
ncbi:unnamed protein product [Sympodiomycopsis kandeliae]